MAKVKIKIEVNPNADDEELGNIQNQVNNTPSLENVSNVSVKIRGDGIYEEIPSNSGGINGLSLGYALVFDGNGYLDNADLEGGVIESTENPVEFVWGVVPESGEYTVRLTFTDAQSLKDITIFGDSEVNQFPTRAIIDGYKEITNDDLTWYINFGNEASTHTIEFTHWNKVNYNACLSKIGITLQYIEIDKTSGLKSVDSTSQSSTDTTGIFYGTVENRGSLEILDKTGELVDMLKDGIIDNSNTKIEIVANNESVQTHISTDSTYNANSQVMSLDLGNRLSSLDILKYKGYYYPDHSERLSVLFFDVLSNLRYALFGKDKELTEEEFKEMLSAKYDSTKTLYDYLYSIEIKYPFIEPNKTYREVIDEFCLIAQMQMYIDDEDNVNFVSARPKVFDENAERIHIPKKNMFSQLDYAVVLKNKYDGVEISKTDVSDVTDFDATLMTSDKITNFDSFTRGLTSNLDTIPELNSQDYRTFIDGYYVYIRNYYYNETFSIPKYSDNNLSQVTAISNQLLSKDGTPRYQLNFQKDIATYNSSRATLIFNDSNEIIAFGGEDGEQGWIGYDGTLTETLTSRINPYADIDGTKVYVPKGNYSEKITVGFINGRYIVDVSILVGQKITVADRRVLTNVGAVAQQVCMPESLEFTIYGNKRTITFNEIDSSTSNIESAKTKLSLSSTNLLQNENNINDIKNNILYDYQKGISNATVSVSCNDYYDANGEKVIDWAKGEIPKVHQLVYFDNDLYSDGSQRYWKIKGRTFRKTGIPMIDLELEELKKRELRDYTWSEISEISASGNADKIFALGDTKTFTLTNGKELTAKIIAFNHDIQENGNKAGITFIVTDLNETSVMASENTFVNWQDSIIRKEFLPNIYSLISNGIKNYIKPTKKISNDYDIFTETIDYIWLFSNGEVGGKYGNNSEKYNYLVENLSQIIPKTENGSWLRGVFYNNYGDQAFTIYFSISKNYSVVTEVSGFEEKNIVFGFCI